ncbi:O-methylsterigmatocystin oxidoreductase OS=Aspergillus flavus (strain ATCC 200026 / FGSC A1120 / NRRL 3357 / JCM 12722 / SRRC 167) GN=ordA PE=2 SV=1 [Rhizoctonia solani AG-1 IB]|uniref:O-methylsterigmatocystin oxidoreductase n=1 Tax=Thanatephorus cucumeris (strain AG1-IB / isolate 7/3/14) TaxID=1108050 RepID=A0A0B7FB77_THACB|nr:O-methylsterigmatocystin oxidoreductase OS=Aspergillus flavus (strain ATCC 200026 / FGSC A1120 / NRRL 3357 / JCM 12722 / SRRC 167) GN=ordA PE=2 SV=1 [Rhizoctonia solani AG-1 IB]
MSLDAIRRLIAAFPLVVVALALVPWGLYILIRRYQRLKLPLPPGPKSDPLIGHLRVLPASDEHRAYARWGKELNSEIISISIPGQTIVVLNSTKAANELLDKRSAIYSDRPTVPMISYPELVDWSNNTALMRYGERWRSQRRMTNQVLNKGASTPRWPLITEQCRLALQRISKAPEKFSQEIRRMMGSTLLSTVYGYEVTSANDPLVELVETGVDHLSDAAIVGNFYVNIMPWLRHIPDWFPGTKWKQAVVSWRKERDEMVNLPFNWTKSQISSGTAAHSMVQSLLAGMDDGLDLKQCDAETDEKIKWAAVAIFAGGTDTTSASILSFVLAMTLNQHVAAKAQAEIDQVIGKKRLPDMSDRESLPYIECVLREILRWQPAAPIGFPHACMEDDEYQGYFIPKGAIVLCPGIHMAEATLFITIATFLALFDIRPVKDEQGNDIIPEVKMKSNTVVSYPADFKCSITPRSEKAMEILKFSVPEI